MAQKAIIHFAHANGFHAGAYSKMLSLLKQQYEVIAIERLGHDARYPIDDNWQGLVRELGDHIESSAGKPVIGIGHSLGGILTFMAAYDRPQLFSEIIMLDPPLAYGPVTLLLFLAKKLRVIDRVRVVSQTRKRRTLWSNEQEAEAYFRRIPLFNRFDPDCLRDYIRYGTISVETGVRLSFDVNIEATIFRTTPHNMTCLRKRLGVPGAVIVGDNSYMAGCMLRSFAKRHALYLERLKDGSHLFPLEYPERTAVLVMETIRKLETLECT